MRGLHGQAYLLPPPLQHWLCKQIRWRKLREGTQFKTEYELYEGRFETPIEGRVRQWMPPECLVGRVQLLKPKNHPKPGMLWLMPLHPGQKETNLCGRKVEALQFRQLRTDILHCTNREFPFLQRSPFIWQAQETMGSAGG